MELSKLEKVMKKDAGGMTDLEKWAVFLRYAAEPGCRGELVNLMSESGISFGEVVELEY